MFSDKEGFIWLSDYDIFMQLVNQSISIPY